MNPLPLIDGNNLFIDNSSLELLMTCSRQLQYSYIDRRVTTAPRPALNFGSAVHAAMSYRYARCAQSPDEAHRIIMAQLIEQYFDKNPQPENDFRTPALCRDLVDLYNRYHAIEPFEVLKRKDGKPFVEFSGFNYLGTLVHPSTKEPINIQYMYRIDLGVSRNSLLWTVDHKTASKMGQSNVDEQQMSAQHLGYCWGFWRSTGILPAGYIVNFFRVRGEIQTPTLDEWTRIKTTGPRTDDFSRIDEYVTLDRMEEWKQNTLALCEELLWHHSHGYFPMKQKWCVGKYGRCQYYDVCHSPGNSRSELLANDGQFKNNDWSPLNINTGETHHDDV